jgi:hypothetical protein
MTCINDHPVCERDHPIIRRRIQIMRIIRVAAVCNACTMSTCDGCSTARKLDGMILPLSKKELEG